MSAFGLIIILGSIIVTILFGDSLSPFFDRTIGIQVALLGVGIILFDAATRICNLLRLLRSDSQTGTRILHEATSNLYRTMRDSQSGNHDTSRRSGEIPPPPPLR